MLYILLLGFMPFGVFVSITCQTVLNYLKFCNLINTFYQFCINKACVSSLCNNIFTFHNNINSVPKTKHGVVLSLFLITCKQRHCFI